jgi:hypothetical protein
MSRMRRLYEGTTYFVDVVRHENTATTLACTNQENLVLLLISFATMYP